MKSIVERLLLNGSATSTRSNASNKKFVWKQSPDGKWFNVGSSLKAANLEEMSENPLYTPKDTETPYSFVCGVCSTAMHFRVQDEFDDEYRCSICDAYHTVIQLMCDSCELYVCCGRTRKYYDAFQQEWKYKPSCYGSYYDEVKAVREELYNRQEQVSQLSKDGQQRWLQCMWHDIVPNMTKFRAELQHASQVKTIDDTNSGLVIENLGLEMAKSLVRLFVTFHSKFDADIVEWFLSLIQHQRELFGLVALQTCVKLNGRLEQLKWFAQNLNLDVSNCDFSGAVEIAAMMGKLDILAYLLEDAGADPSVNDNFALRLASRNGHANVVERLLQDDRVDPSAADNDAVRGASEDGHLNVVERLLQDDRVNPSAGNNAAIQKACEIGRVEVVERLLQDDRVDPSAGDDYAIRVASRAVPWWNLEDNLNVVKRLLQDHRVDPAAQGCEAIKKAKNNQVIKCLYDRTRSIACFMVDDEDLMEKLTPLHNDNLVMGGLCLSHLHSTDTIVKTLPQDLVFVILLEWASLSL